MKPTLESWQPRYPELRIDMLSHLHPSIAQALAANRAEVWRQVATPIHPGLYTLPLLTAKACAQLDAEVVELERWALEHELALERPNSMNQYGVILDDIGYRDALAALVEEVVRPLAAVLFPEVGGASLDHHHGFIVNYGDERDRDLGFHVDDSEVTVNLCLGAEFEGGELYFQGRRCLWHLQDPPAADELIDYPHVPGIAVVHAGKHRHGAYPLFSGERRNLILWCRSTRVRSSGPQESCPRWCGAHR
ncbi:MAG: hypothetical protein AAFX99_09855, partial [Myxococcota bacterium]